MMNTGPRTTVSLLLGTIICLGAFFLIDNNIPVQALHKEEQILESYDDLADFANAVKSGDEEDLEEIPIQSMEAADIYDDADDNLKDCIDLAAEVGDSLTDREVVHCVDDANYFETKYASNSTVPANTSFATSTAGPDTNEDTSIDTTSTSDTSTSDTSTSDTSTSDTSTSDTSTSDTSTSDTSTSDNVTGNSLIDELVKTGKFTEDEAKQFVSQNMLAGADTTSSSDDTSSNTNTGDTQASSNTDTNTGDTQASSNTDTNTGDTQASNTGDTQASNTGDTQASNTGDTQASSNTDTNTDNATSSNNEENQTDTSDSNNSGNPEDYDSLSALVKDIKNGVVDTDNIPLNDLQNSGAYQGADEQTQDCIDLAAKFGSNLNDYEIVRCSEDPNHFKNMIANSNANNNEANNNAESNNANNNNNGGNNESDDGTA